MNAEVAPLVEHPRQRMTQVELDRAVLRHEMYQAGRLGGHRAVLTYRDLSGLDLAGKILANVDLSASFLVDANLAGTDFQHATLFACDLSRANLRGAILTRTDLR